MSIDHLVEDKHVKVTEDTVLNGVSVDAGAKLTFILREGQYSGFKMRVPPPEFEALLFFNAIDSAAKAETLKKMIKVEKSSFDQMIQIDAEDSNRSLFYSMCQSAMASVAFSISAIESWANNSIHVYGMSNSLPTELTLKRPGKPDRKVTSISIASDSSIPIRPKLFQLVPQVFSCSQLKEHSTIRKRLGDIVEERNIVMHMQNTLNISNEEVERLNYAVQLYKVNSFVPLDVVLSYITYIYDNSPIEIAEWVTVATKEIEKLKRKLK
jgi:hypothetical protein